MFDVRLPHKRFALTAAGVDCLVRLLRDGGNSGMANRLEAWSNDLGDRPPFSVAQAAEVNVLLEALCQGRPLPAELDEVLRHLTGRLGRACPQSPPIRVQQGEGFRLLEDLILIDPPNSSAGKDQSE